MASIDAITRRGVLKAAPAAAVIGAGAAVIAVAAEPTETEISRLFAKWRARYEGDAVIPSEPIAALEAQIAALTPTNLRDYALKIIVWTIDGSETVGCHMDSLMIDEMRKIAGETSLFVS